MPGCSNVFFLEAARELAIKLIAAGTSGLQMKAGYLKMSWQELFACPLEAKKPPAALLRSASLQRQPSCMACWQILIDRLLP